MADSTTGYQRSAIREQEVDMASTASPLSKNRLRRVITSRYFWIVGTTLVLCALFHYFTPQIRVPALASFPLTRQAIGRIIFILPIAGAAFAFGQAGGLITLAIAVLIMLPRVFLVSPYPADALLETIAVAVVGYLVIWMIETQEREKRLRQKAASRLRAINAVTAIVTESLELEQILNGALDKVLEVTGLEAGLIFFLDKQTQELILAAYRGISDESAAGVDRLKVGEGFSGRVAQSGELMVVQDSSRDPRLTRLAVRQEGLRGQIIVPLKSKGEVQGVSAVATRESRQFLPEELELITAIGNQIGVAIENARLYENMRFYVRQTTKAQEDERKRIARELHDETAQALIDLSRRLDDLATSPERLSETAIGRLEEFQELIDSILWGVRRFSRDLRPSVLDDLGLLPALEWLTANLMEDSGIKTELKVYGERQRLPPEAELALFRIVQEALNNVRKHSQASQVVTVVEFGDGSVRITMSDNGQGFELPGRTGDLATTGKLGLIGMHERARLLDGTLTVHSEPGKGTTITVDVPV
jgi:two-component system sensor histidine kinase DegS